MFRLFFCNLAICFALQASIVVHAQETSPASHAEKFPTAKNIISDYVDAIGSEMALRRIRSTKITAEYVGEGGRSNGPVIFLSDGEKWFYEIESNGQKQTRIFDSLRAIDGAGSIGSPLEGIKLRKFHEVIPRVTNPLSWLNYDGTIELTGKDWVDDRPCYVLKFQPPSGPPYVRYFDVKSKLMVKLIYTSVGREGQMIFSDFRDVEGIQVPFRRKQLYDGVFHYTIVKKSVEFNLRIDNHPFEIPESSKK